MAAGMNEYLSDLIGTLRSFFKIGAVRLKDASGVIEVRNAGDTAYGQANASTLGIAGSNATNKCTITAPAELSGNVAIVLPGAHGSSGQVLADTDGAGTLGWVNPASNGMLFEEVSFSEASSSPLALFTPPANSVITDVIVTVSSAAAGGSPSLAIGVAGTTERDMATAENSLLEAATYSVKPMTNVGGTPAAMIATIVVASQTFSGKILIGYSVPS